MVLTIFTVFLYDFWYCVNLKARLNKIQYLFIIGIFVLTNLFLTFAYGGIMKKKESRVIEIRRIDTAHHLPLPFADEGIKAGFPSPAQDFMDLFIDLNEELVKHPASTFYGRVKGDSMWDAGIGDGDILIIDKSLEPRDGDTAVCFIDGEFTIKQIRLGKGEIWLVPANEKYPAIKITAENDFLIWGIVTYSIKPHRSGKK